MCLAMAALVVVQAYWIKNAWLVKEQQFDILVYRSMIDISREVEKREASEIIVHQIDPLSLRTGFFVPPRQDSAILNVKPPQAPTPRSLDKMKIDQERKPEMGEWLKNRRAFIDRIITGMIMRSPEIDQRINLSELEETIRKVLNTNGVELSFEYAVMRFNNDMLYRSSNYDPAAAAEFFRVQLFPEDIFVSANYLSVYFPERKNFLFKSISYVALGSLLLTLAIAGSLFFTMVFMFKQKRLTEIRNDFVSNMTHELKTPISTISLASQMLGDKSIPTEIKNMEQISKIISEECRRLGVQVEKVLQTAVFDKGKLRLRMAEADLHEIISGILENFSIQIRSRNGRITADLKANHYTLLADNMHITNVLSNLLDNAVKYCDRDPEIHVSTADKGDFVMVSVKDNGHGISKADQKRIFEQFYRIPTGNVHAVKGFGLGLSYVKMIVEAHQGYVDVESELYQGSTFKIFIPLKDHGNHTKDKNPPGGG